MKKILVMIFSICLLVGCNNTEKTDNDVKNLENHSSNAIIESDENEMQGTSNINSNDENDKIVEETKEEEVIKFEEEKKLDDVTEISVNATALSNKTNAWGFVRKKDGVQPEFAAIIQNL